MDQTSNHRPLGTSGQTSVKHFTVPGPPIKTACGTELRPYYRFSHQPWRHTTKRQECTCLELFASDATEHAMTANASELPALPALKRLGKLADLRPVVIIDTREQTPLPITRLETVRAGLQTADYSFQGGEHLFGIERKSVDDLVSCCMGDNRERFEREMHRLRGFRFKRLLIIGHRWMIEGQRYKSKIKPAAVLHSLDAWEARYDLPVIFCEYPTQAAELVEKWVWWFAREMVEDANSLLRGSKTAVPATVEESAAP